MDIMDKRIADLKLEGMTNTDIAKVVGLDRKTVGVRLRDDEERPHMDGVSQDISSSAKKKLEHHLDFAIASLIDIGRSAESEKIRLQAVCEILDRVLGKPTVKAELEATVKQNKSINLEKELEDIEKLLDSVTPEEEWVRSPNRKRTQKS